jgi:hypothetical protein
MFVATLWSWRLAVAASRAACAGPSELGMVLLAAKQGLAARQGARLE